MSNRNIFVSRGANERSWDKIAAGTILVLSLSMLSFNLYASSIFLVTVPVVLVSASALYLWSTKYDVSNFTGYHWRLSSETTHVIRTTTAVGLAGMVFVATYTGGRTLPFFGIAAVVGSLILAQIFFTRESALHPPTVLVQIVTFALVVRAAALVFTPGLVGVDSWEHLYEYAAAIRETGQLAAISDVKYFTAPLYHLLVVVAADLFHSSLRTALYLTLGVVMPMSVALMYYISRHFVSVRWALFTAAAFGVADHAIRWGIHIIPTSMGLVFFTAVVYSVTKIATTRDAGAMYALALFFAIATLLTHQISILVTLVFLGAGTAAQLLLRLDAFGGGPGDVSTVTDRGQSVNFAGLFLVVLPLTLIDWALTPQSGGSFLGVMLGEFQNRAADMGFLDLASRQATVVEPIESMVVTVPTSYELLYSLGFLLVLFISVVGISTVLRRRHFDLLPASLSVSSGIMLAVTLGLPLLGLYMFLPNRWYAFMYVPLFLLGAYGLQHLELTLPKHQLLAVLLVTALLFPGAMLVNDKATRDNPVNDRYRYQYAYTESEIAAAETVASLHPDGAVLATDQPYRLLFRDWQQEPTTALTLTEDGTTTNRYVVYRRSQTTGGTGMEFRDTLVRVERPPEAVCRPSMEIAYSNGNIRYCTEP